MTEEVSLDSASQGSDIEAFGSSEADKKVERGYSSALKFIDAKECVDDQVEWCFLMMKQFPKR